VHLPLCIYLNSRTLLQFDITINSDVAINISHSFVHSNPSDESTNLQSQLLQFNSTSQRLRQFSSSHTIMKKHYVITLRPQQFGTAQSSNHLFDPSIAHPQLGFLIDGNDCANQPALRNTSSIHVDGSFTSLVSVDGNNCTNQPVPHNPSYLPKYVKHFRPSSSLSHRTLSDLPISSYEVRPNLSPNLNHKTFDRSIDLSYEVHHHFTTSLHFNSITTSPTEPTNEQSRSKEGISIQGL